MSIEYIRHLWVVFAPTNICFWQYLYKANVGWGRVEYLQIFVGGYIAAPCPIYAPYADCTSNISFSRRISVIYSSMLGPPMMYITHISSKSSAFETIRVNKSMNRSPILASIESCMCANIRICEYVLVPYLECTELNVGSGLCVYRPYSLWQILEYLLWCKIDTCIRRKYAKTSICDCKYSFPMSILATRDALWLQLFTKIMAV
jgi:hypothetical protein